MYELRVGARCALVLWADDDMTAGLPVVLVVNVGTRLVQQYRSKGGIVDRS